MPLTTIRTVVDHTVTATHTTLGTPAGARAYVVSPVRGRIIEAGFVPASLVASAITMAVAVNNAGISPTASNFANVISSAVATFSSTNLYEGACASAQPASPAYVNPGDAIQFVTSGGNTSAIGGTIYAVIRAG